MKKKKFIYNAFGFPVFLSGIRIKRVRGVEVPDINLNELQKLVFEILISKPTPFSGAEVRFIRAYLRMTQTEFSRLLNQSGHSIVSQWEKKVLKPTGMDPNTEVLLRLHMAKTLKRSELITYLESFLEELPFKVKSEPTPITVNWKMAS